MLLRTSLLLFSTAAAAMAVTQFECPSDNILRFGIEKRAKEFEKDCTFDKTQTAMMCDSRDELDKAWREFVDTADQYAKAVKDCRDTLERNKKRVERRRRDHKHDPNDPNIDHTGHNHRRRRDHVHDPNDPNIDHTGHNHRRRRDHKHDPNDPNIDHTGHNHRRRRDEKHDPNDPNIDHTGHNHRRRRCPLQGYRDGPNPCDPPAHPVDQGRPAEDDDRIIRSKRFVEDEYMPVVSRAKRQECTIAGREEVERMQEKYSTHCQRTNICLPDEDLGANAAESFKKLHKQHAATYANYVRALSSCYGSLKN